MKKLSLLVLAVLLSIGTFAQGKPKEKPKKATESTQRQNEKRAMFPGGDKEMNAFIVKNLEYPQLAIDSAIEGNVVVSFIVLQDGRLDSIQVVNKAHPLLVEAAIQVIQKMPRWEPATQKGIVVNQRMTLPIRFKLDGKKPKKEKKKKREK